MVVGRFQVMAVLQAARAMALGLSKPSAKSWGLNRAIFYAAAKRGFRGAPSKRRSRGDVLKSPVMETKEEFFLGSEMAFKAKSGPGGPFFIIGDKVQTEEEFTRQIEARFGKAFEKAWVEALEYVKKFEKAVLLSQTAFYNEVYKPRRDELAANWTSLSEKSG